jgi:hypothetical protein
MVRAPAAELPLTLHPAFGSIQEYVLAKTIEIWSSGIRVQADAVSRFIAKKELHHRETRLSTSSPATRVINLRLMQLASRHRDFLYLVGRFGPRMLCADVRDRVYALLSLLSPSERDWLSITPDYTKSTSELFTSVLRSFRIRYERYSDRKSLLTSIAYRLATMLYLSKNDEAVQRARVSVQKPDEQFYRDLMNEEPGMIALAPGVPNSTPKVSLPSVLDYEWERWSQSPELGLSDEARQLTITLNECLARHAGIDQDTPPIAPGDDIDSLFLEQLFLESPYPEDTQKKSQASPSRLEVKHHRGGKDGRNRHRAGGAPKRQQSRTNAESTAALITKQWEDLPKSSLFGRPILPMPARKQKRTAS